MITVQMRNGIGRMLNENAALSREIEKDEWETLTCCVCSYTYFGPAGDG
jgi:hypothetical protein